MPAKSPALPHLDYGVLASLSRRAFYYATRMIHDANHRSDKQEGDPKVGGHPAACSSCVHILSALHLAVREPQDFLCSKPHASPVDHSLQYMLGLFGDGKGGWLEDAEAGKVMGRLRKFSAHGEPVLQSYHAESDPDGHNFFPSGSVGIPPVVSVYTALAYRYARDHRLAVPAGTHFWSLIGDSEFREGSLMEALPDVAERELGDVTWIIDYNRQNLDGTRIPNNRSLKGCDCDRIERTAAANGWEVIQVRHGRRREAAFAGRGGALFRETLEQKLSDFELQMLLLKRDGAATRAALLRHQPALKRSLDDYDDPTLQGLLEDLGGHDLEVLVPALLASKTDPDRPTMLIVHTVKGWGLECWAHPGNHSALPEPAEVARLTAEAGLTEEEPYALFSPYSPEAHYLAGRRKVLREGIEAQWALRAGNLRVIRERFAEGGDLPKSVDVNLKYFPVAHTQWMWGQVASKVIRVGNEAERQRRGEKVELKPDEVRWAPVADLIMTMAPDVGTSTNISPNMDDKIYGPAPERDFDDELAVDTPDRPDLSPSEEAWTRHIRFEIAEANCMSAAGAFGKMYHHLGIPFLPIMTVYDFFIKRALDQLYYNLYWGASFICVGTPSGITLAPEGAQHSWKSDFQMPNQVTWEPLFAVELSWIFAETIRRHFLHEDHGRSGVIVRAVTRGIRQGLLIERLRRQARYKQDLAPDARLSLEAEPRAGAVREAEVPPQSDADILEQVRRDCLEGAYALVDYRGYDGYEPGDNVVHLFSMGALGPEAVAASDRLLAKGIYANVFAVTSPDLLLGNLAHENGYRHLAEGLGVTGDLHLAKGRAVESAGDLVCLAGGRIPIVSVCDGEPGLLDNLGSVVGVKQEALAVRKASKCGRPSDVYAYQHMDPDGIAEAAERILAAAARENVVVARGALESLGR